MARRPSSNLAEAIVEFVENQIVMPTMGAASDGHHSFSAFSRLSTSATFREYSGHSDVTARMALPLLSLLVWVVFIGVGFKHQGLGYLKNSLFPPGCPGRSSSTRSVVDVPRASVLAQFVCLPTCSLVASSRDLCPSHEELVQGGNIALVGICRSSC